MRETPWCKEWSRTALDHGMLFAQLHRDTTDEGIKEAMEENFRSMGQGLLSRADVEARLQVAAELMVSQLVEI